MHTLFNLVEKTRLFYGHYRIKLSVLVFLSQKLYKHISNKKTIKLSKTPIIHTVINRQVYVALFTLDCSGGIFT